MNIAILIDAENVLPSHADAIFDHAAGLGAVVYREIYGAAQALTSWVAPVLKYAMHANLTIRASKGKNSSDIALVIGAMDLLVANAVDCVVIASSDSDFSALSIRLRNAGIEVIGMGTEKANELWRTACSSFVVLQNPKPKAQPQPQSAPKPAAKPAPKPAPKAEEQKQQPKKPAHAAASTHEERAAVIRQFIQKQLQSHGGKLQTGTLFPLLNKLHEYQADKRGEGKKPLNYLTSTFGDIFRFEDTPDGNSWVSLMDAAPAAEAPATGAEPQPAATAEEPVETAQPVETAPEEPVTEPAEAPAQEEVPAAEPDLTNVMADLDVEEQPEAPDPLALLIDSGLPEDVARQIVVIFTESDNLREAYNKLRTTFGNTTGRDYYQKVKEIAGAR